MKILRLLIFLPLAAVLLLQSACLVTRRATPQSDIDAFEIGEDVFGTKILLASRDRDFKLAVARRIVESLKDEPVYVRFIEINQLEIGDVDRYTAIILMTKCTTWEMDPKTQSFLKKNQELSNVVVLTTSGDGDWKPDVEGKKLDAITSASVMTDADSIAEEILEKVRTIIRAEACSQITFAFSLC